jgi:heat shock protein HslJ
MVAQPAPKMGEPMHRIHWTFACAAIAASLLTGCRASAPEPPPTVEGPPAAAAPAPTFADDVIGKTWEWIGVMSPSSQVEVDAPARYTVQFDRDGFAFIQADCNRGQANYFLPAAGQLAIHGIALSRVACPAGSMGQRFVDQLELVRSYAMADGNLVLEMPGETGSLVFRAKP